MVSKSAKNLNSLCSENDSERTTKPNVQEASIVHHEPTEVAVKATPARGRKRKARDKAGTSSKRRRVPTDNTEREEKAKRLLDTYTQHLRSTSFPYNTSKDDFEMRYEQLEKLGEGGFGCVYAGYRIYDNLPVAIKHIPQKKVKTQKIVLNKREYEVPTEVLIMQRVAGEPKSVGKSVAVTLIDWFTLDQEVVLVMERPEPCVDLFKYIKEPLEEHQAKIFMKDLVNAAVEISSKGVVHADIKPDNILLETSSDVPRLRLIDFGISLFVGETPFPATTDYDINRAKNAERITVWQLGATLIDMMVSLDDIDSSSNSDADIPLLSGLKKVLTQDCKDFLSACLNRNSEERPTLEQVKQHPWINETK